MWFIANYVKSKISYRAVSNKVSERATAVIKTEDDIVTETDQGKLTILL